MKREKVLLVVDGMNLLHRGHFATPPMTNSDGLPTNAIRGMITIMLADIKRVEATHCAVIFDRPGKNFRHDLYPEYKANRGEESDSPNMHDLVPLARRLIRNMGIKVIGKIGIEGDDLIGSVAVNGAEFVSKVYISSNDKDFASIVDDKVHLLKPKGLILDASGVLETYGVHPHQMIEYLMMLGDTVDHIPGINKVGPKTAAKWLAKHGTLRKVVANEKFTKKMQANIDAARPMFSLSRKLITLQLHHMTHLTGKDLLIKGPQPGLKSVCTLLEFHSTYRSIVNTLG